MITLSISTLAQQLNSHFSGKNATFHGVSKDTRTIKPGNLYVAIQGEQFDGHDFVEEAFRQGASAALVSRHIDSDIPQIIVEDTLNALGKMSVLWRNTFSPTIIGVTGSNGKTTLKNMIASILRAACANDNDVLATEGNLNNNIGVPMMLCRLNAQHRYAVIEMGMNHFGEIDYLTRLTRPNVAVVNNAAESHLEGLKSIAGVAKAKGEIFTGLTENGIAILNRDDAHFAYWRGLVKNYLTFGLQHTADVTATFSGNQITLQTPKGTIDVTLPLLGKHNIMNALAATAAALAIDIDLAAIKQGLENVRPEHGRMEQYHLANGTRIIDDTYNANPFSTQAAVNTLAEFPGDKVIVLADMRELGPDAKQMHFQSGEKIRAANIQTLLTFGDLSAAATEAFGTNAKHFTDRDELIAEVKKHVKPNTTILIKGSRSMRMEKVVASILKAESIEHSH